MWRSRILFFLIAGIAIFDERTAHLLMAAADYVIIPSRFEPCGLVAQSAARYGAIPIVTAVGGLKDFVTDEVCLTCSLESTASCGFNHGQQIISAREVLG